MTALGVDKVGCEDGVDQSGLSKTSLTYFGRQIGIDQMYHPVYDLPTQMTLN